MPKLIVIVDKDDKGKIWDFVFNENEWARNQNSFRTYPITVHTATSPENTKPQPQAPPKEDHLTIGVLPFRLKRSRTKKSLIQDSSAKK